MNDYDSVLFKCPGCTHKLPIQSSAGLCFQVEYAPDEVPRDVAGDLLNRFVPCPTCKKGYRIHPKEDTGETVHLFLRLYS